MSVISTQDMERYRQIIASIDLPDDRKDDVIRIVHSIMSHFVDSAFGVQTDQISLESRKKSRFHAAFNHARIGTNPEHETVDPLTGSARNDSSLQGQIAP